MKNIKIILFLIVPFLLTNCGKPTIPESLVDSGGYKIVSKYHTAGYAQDLVIDNNLAYIAQGEGGLMIIDITNPEKPTTVSIKSEGIRGYSAKIAKKDSAVYLAAGSYGITVVEVADPSNPNISAANVGIKPSKNLLVFGDYLYTPISEQGVKIADISYPTQPDPRGVTNTSGYAHGVAITSDTNKMLIACGEMGLSIFNIENFQNGFGDFPLLGLADTPGYAEAVVVSNDSKYAFMACGTAGLQIVDFSDTSNVHIVGSYDGIGYAKEVILKGDLIYIAAEKGGLQIIDIKDVNNPTLVGQLLTGFALGVDADDKYIYVADEIEGLVTVLIP